MISDKIKFTKIDESRNMKRFYVLHPVCDTLLDGVYAVVSEYGRIGRTGRTFIKLFADQKSAWNYYTHCIATRINHGYTRDQSIHNWI
ncbi:WGR domain-containing protein [Athalassotoga sp.]|uniref:WGR domain-containing protein n=2 Tax=Athalassotoga sp. TaxID=2022597 RepID=UPI003D090AE6